MLSSCHSDDAPFPHGGIGSTLGVRRNQPLKNYRADPSYLRMYPKGISMLRKGHKTRSLSAILPITILLIYYRMSRLTDLRSRVESGFLGFWIRKYRISYLIVILVMVMGILAVLAIPKESSPSIKLGIISVSTVYLGTNPEDMDSLITDKIYKEVKDIK